jgi:hypothetical protein
MLKRAFLFYYNGFRSITWGRSLWAVFFNKLFVMFMILKLFFFPNVLNRNFETDEERVGHVLEQLTNPINND